MSRELKRVPLDFNWPKNNIWKGYINPHYVSCSGCGGTGENEAARELLKGVQGIIWNGLVNRGDGDFIALTSGLAGREPTGKLGHDSLDAITATRKIIALAGLPDTWGTCKICNGEGVDPNVAEKYNAWEPSNPPTGEGYQLWENVTEGSPISPVFKTLDELCTWCEKNATTFASFKATKERWKEMLLNDCVCHESGNAIFM